MERAAKSAHVVASIEDLLSKILCLLSLKDLLRFKTVSKHWRAFISHPNFCRLRNPNHSSAISGVFLPAVAGQLREYVPFSTNRSGIFRLNFPGQISQSCNGLLLVQSDGDLSYSVYNPTTNCCSELPQPDGGWCFSKRMTLAFDPLVSRHYKVVCIRFLELSFPNRDQLIIEMYSSETRSWGVCGEPFPRTVDIMHGVYWNGAVHWLGVRGGRGLYFNVEHQVLKEMPILPSRHYGGTLGSDYYFGHSCGHLHLIENPDSVIPLDVYEMKRDYSEWLVKYRVDLSPAVIVTNRLTNYNYVMPARISGYMFVYLVLNVIRGETEDDSFLVIMTPYGVIRYNIVSETFVSLYELENSRFPRNRGNGFEYIESLCGV